MNQDQYGISLFSRFLVTSTHQETKWLTTKHFAIAVELGINNRMVRNGAFYTLYFVNLSLVHSSYYLFVTNGVQTVLFNFGGVQALVVAFVLDLSIAGVD